MTPPSSGNSTKSADGKSVLRVSALKDGGFEFVTAHNGLGSEVEINTPTAVKLISTLFNSVTTGSPREQWTETERERMSRSGQALPINRIGRT